MQYSLLKLKTSTVSTHIKINLMPASNMDLNTSVLKAACPTSYSVSLCVPLTRSAVSRNDVMDLNPAQRNDDVITRRNLYGSAAPTFTLFLLSRSLSEVWSMRFCFL